MEKYGCLFEEYHDQRIAYLAGAVFTLKAFIFGTTMAAAQQLPQFCRIEGWVVTVTGWLLTVYCLYSRPFFEARYNFFSTVDFFLQAVGLSFLMHTHSSGESTQKQILIVLALMVAAQLYFNLVDLFIALQQFIVEKLVQGLKLVGRICCMVSAKVGLTPILERWSAESGLSQAVTSSCEWLGDVPANVSDYAAVVQIRAQRFGNKLLRRPDDGATKKDETEPGVAMLLSVQRDANVHALTAQATSSFLALHRPLASPVPGLLTVTIHKANGLGVMDQYCLDQGSSDPYVKIKVGGQEPKTTTVREKELDPEWHETFSFQVDSMDDEIVLELWDRDSWWKISSDEFMGQVSLGKISRLLCSHPTVAGSSVRFERNLKRRDHHSILSGRSEATKNTQGRLYFDLGLSPLQPGPSHHGESRPPGFATHISTVSNALLDDPTAKQHVDPWKLTRMLPKMPRVTPGVAVLGVAPGSFRSAPTTPRATGSSISES